MTMIFFLFPNSRQTLRTIVPGASWKGFPPRICLWLAPTHPSFPGFQCMEVCDDDLCFPDLLLQPEWEDVPSVVVVLRIGRQQYAQAVTDGNPGRYDQEGVSEPGVLGSLQLVQRMPGQQHRHDDGLATSRRHLKRDAV